MIEFEPWPKTPRLNRGMVITEKIDGTNSAVGIQARPWGTHWDGTPDGALAVVCGLEVGEDGLPIEEYVVYAQSRKRIITPGKSTDNFGFARWVQENALELVQALGPGLHFGEWWGKGIQRGYGLDERRFSLFNVNRYAGIDFLAHGLHDVWTVPTLFEGHFNTTTVDEVVEELRISGSRAVPWPWEPEGVVVFHEASRQVYKVLCEGDELPKSLLADVSVKV